jgi:transposase
LFLDIVFLFSVIYSFVSYELHRYVTKNVTFQRAKNNPYPSQGHMRKIKSFQVVVKENNRSSLDGLFALVASPKSKLSAEEMVILYRQKYLIENAFREMKSILKLRPWFVYTEAHVRAHYTVCVVAFILERMLDLLLEENHLKQEGYTLGRLKEELSRFHLIEMKIGNLKHRTLQKMPAELSGILKKIGLQKAITLPN